ncbi:hypothetical protein Nepgr_018651 [Nepenthes gracilis]|uniref:Uncharacterized protein n=1 Tax=Nepenthes gracilis TaxID=150966 RepID=A0AAD3STP7_NEPGR|nr:hypothetical protein Nepgr_018651 [Nepenthes gracilis]
MAIKSTLLRLGPSNFLHDVAVSILLRSCSAANISDVSDFILSCGHCDVSIRYEFNSSSSTESVGRRSLRVMRFSLSDFNAASS